MDRVREFRNSQYKELPDLPDDSNDIPLATLQPAGRKRAGSSLISPFEPYTLDNPFDPYTINSDYNTVPEDESTAYDPHGLRSPYAPINPRQDPSDRTDRNSLLSQTSSNSGRRFFVGWRFGVINCAMSVSVVLVINIALCIAVATRTGIQEGRGTLLDGNCTQARQLNTGLHLLINAFSTVLLAASNYCMQCLSAPTRKEIDRAHAMGRALDVGIPSTKNLRFINKKRTVMWVILGLSSLPLHLFYNSVVFATISTNNYNVYEVNHGFEKAGDIKIFGRFDNGKYEGLIEDLHNAAVNGTLEKLENDACIRAYAQDYIANRANLLLVKTFTVNVTDSPAVYSYSEAGFSDDSSTGCIPDAFPWICGNDHSCDIPCQRNIDKVLADTSNWTPFGSKTKVDYCLSQKVPEHCTLQFSMTIIAIVITFNIIKAALMIYLAFGMREAPILTVGDAVMSFLKRRDQHTKGRCLVDKFSFSEYSTDGLRRSQWPPAMAVSWSPKRRRWQSAITFARKFVFALFIVIALAVSIFLLTFGVNQMSGGAEDKSLPALFKLGVGAVNARTLIHGWAIPSAGDKGLVSNILIANLAQPILSLIYFTYNGVFTCMLLGYEWDGYSRSRKGLRISSIPEGAQRSTYFLQLPYRFAIPIMAISGILHWLLSQSIFLVMIDRFNPLGEPIFTYRGRERTSQFLTCGYSPAAIFLVVMVAVVMVVFQIGMGFRRYKGPIPLAGSNSGVISAACHLDDGLPGREVILLPLKWGVTSNMIDGEIRHCAFSAAEVYEPEEGTLYAGVVDEAKKVA